MTMAETIIRLQTPDDRKALKHLHDKAFGPGRFSRTAYRIREGAVTDDRLNLCAVTGDVFIGAVQFTPISIGGVDGALLLGPLVIADAYKNQGWGLKLMLDGMKLARVAGYNLVILVGDRPYYARANFVPAPHGRFILPGPVDTARILYAELSPNALAKYAGVVRGIPET